jgi:hypothetical protein
LKTFEAKGQPQKFWVLMGDSYRRLWRRKVNFWAWACFYGASRSNFHGHTRLVLVWEN